MDPSEIEAQLASGMASRILEEIEPHLIADDRATMKSIFDDIRQGNAIDPERAVQAWYRLWSNERLRGRFRRAAGQGRGTAPHRLADAGTTGTNGVDGHPERGV